ncbi:MAG TPA: hypothetical protein VFK02_27430 [Kofleriaceae bacterium]|nr:hypothetical protein [Kofleriaceae bacterium]
MGKQLWWMLAGIAACGTTDPSNSYVARDPCAALAIDTTTATPEQQGGIADALALWRGRGVAAFDLTAPVGDAAAIQIRFDDAAATFHGVYDPASASVLINRDLVDRSMLAIVVAHELGHVFGLAHVPLDSRRSLMNPGNVVTPPTDDDQRALEAMWGTCPPGATAAAP